MAFLCRGGGGGFGASAVVALQEAGATEWDLSLLFCDDGRMTELNGSYRGKKGPTDVLSFPRETSRRARKTPSPRCDRGYCHLPGHPEPQCQGVRSNRWTRS